VTKQEQFLWIVQTTILANGINLASQRDFADKYRHKYSGTSVMGLMTDVIFASEQIPSELSVTDAAADFCGYMLWRDEGTEGTKRPELPHWFARW
jgi:hypothetical protein